MVEQDRNKKGRLWWGQTMKPFIYYDTAIQKKSDGNNEIMNWNGDVKVWIGIGENKQAGTIVTS